MGRCQSRDRTRAHGASQLAEKAGLYSEAGIRNLEQGQRTDLGMLKPA
jgi:hypothetical protein